MNFKWENMRRKMCTVRMAKRNAFRSERIFGPSPSLGCHQHRNQEANKCKFNLNSSALCDAARCSLSLAPLHNSRGRWNRCASDSCAQMVHILPACKSLRARKNSDDAPQKQTSQGKRRCVSLQRSFHRMHPCKAHESGSENTKIKR